MPSHIVVIDFTAAEVAAIASEFGSSHPYTAKMFQWSSDLRLAVGASVVLSKHEHPILSAAGAKVVRSGGTPAETARLLAEALGISSGSRDALEDVEGWPNRSAG